MRPIQKFLISFAIFVAICAVGVSWFVNNEVEKSINEAVAQTEGLQLAYTDCSVSIVDQCVTLAGVDAVLPSGQHITADEIRIQTFDQLNPLPHFAKATATNLTIPVTRENFGQWAQPMKAMGIETVTGNASLDYFYAPDTSTLTVKELSMDGTGLGHARLSGTVDQLDLLNPRPEQLIGLRIKEASLNFTNASFMDHLISDWAKRMNISKEETVARITAELGGLAKYAGKEANEPAENVLLGLKRFLADPGTMTATVAPKEPVPVLYFFMGRDILENIRLLNMTIETDSNDDI